MKELEDNFKASGGKFKEFRIGDLFKSVNGNFDIQKQHIDGKGEFVITAGDDNYGILGRSSINARIINVLSITVDMFGAAYFRDFNYKMVTHARVFSLTSEILKNRKIGLFITSNLKFLKQKFSYSNMASWKKIKNEKILLPCDSNEEIAFDFMESFITELEAEHITELEAYLEATNLKDYNLNNKDKESLQEFANLNNDDGGGGFTKSKMV